MVHVRGLESLLRNSRRRMEVANCWGGAGRFCPPLLCLLRSSESPMSSLREDSIPHEQRTAAEPRQQGLYPVHLSRVEQANPSIRLLQFTVPADRNNPWPNRLRPQEDIHPDYHLPGANVCSLNKECSNKSLHFSKGALTPAIYLPTWSMARCSYTLYR